MRAWSRAEALALGGLLALGAVFRGVLAVRGWPTSNSDEATLGLMADDILWHGAHPVFFYGQHYLGALQAYLAAVFFAVFGPTNVALHLLTTAQTMAFLVVLYALTRRLYSPAVALVTVALLTLGPEQAVFFELRAAAHAQDVLLFGALIVWLVVLALAQPPHDASCGTWQGAWRRVLLPATIGVVLGLGVWGTFLFLPFGGAACLALLVEGGRRGRMLPARMLTARLLAFGVPMLVSAGVVLLPFGVATVASHGVVVREVLTAAHAAGQGGTSAGPLPALSRQVAGSLLVALPILLGRSGVCPVCSLWPEPGHLLAGLAAVRLVLLSAGFSLVALGLAAISVAQIGRVARKKRSPTTSARLGKVDGHTAALSSNQGHARWWGRAILVLGGGATLVVYLASASSYADPDVSSRYLSGLYLCVPLIAAPLTDGARRAWRQLSARRFPAPAALLAAGLLALAFVVDGAGAARTVAQAANPQAVGVPAKSNDMALIAFLSDHALTRFYTSYWVCGRMMFVSRERLTCGVIDDTDVLQPGDNRIPADFALVAAAHAQHTSLILPLTRFRPRPFIICSRSAPDRVRVSQGIVSPASLAVSCTTTLPRDVISGEAQ